MSGGPPQSLRVYFFLELREKLGYVVVNDFHFDELILGWRRPIVIASLGSG